MNGQLNPYGHVEPRRRLKVLETVLFEGNPFLIGGIVYRGDGTPLYVLQLPGMPHGLCVLAREEELIPMEPYAC